MIESNPAIVLIGRNEGERLKICLNSVKEFLPKVVYVDSGSYDNSVKTAREFGAVVLELSIEKPFSAGRARNEGFSEALRLWPNVRLIQFVDGDCEMRPNWMRDAVEFLNENPSTAIVCGRTRERYTEKTLYNMMCDIEWNTPIGYTDACGGIFLARTNAILQSGGFDQTLIAGEEPELCHRLKKLNWKIYRLGAEMALHDANMTTFTQWGKRLIRSGFAFANTYWSTKADGQKFNLSANLNIIFYSICVPAISILIYSLYGSIAAVLFFIFCQIYLINKIAWAFRFRSQTYRNLMIYSVFLVIGKYFQCYGQLKFFSNILLNKNSTLIEYK